MDSAFIGLSLIGAGSIGAAVKAGKVADVAFDGAKLLTKATKIGADIEPIEKLTSAGIKSFNKANNVSKIISEGGDEGIN